MGYQLMTQTQTSSRGQRYVPPEFHEIADLQEMLASSGREVLEIKQLSWLDKGGSDAPKLELYLVGERSLVKRRTIAVIGTRKVSDLGRKRANKFARELAEAGIVVASGLADGVDTQALQAAINAGGKVIAVIGTPIDKSYPAKNARLQELIYRDHLLISQFPIGKRTFPSSFPERNRTMAAISDGSVIIEASESSGTLHQAAECVRLNRWLGISKSVVDDPKLTWPKKFLDYSRCVVLTDTQEFIQRVYAD